MTHSLKAFAAARSYGIAATMNFVDFALARLAAAETRAAVFDQDALEQMRRRRLCGGWRHSDRTVRRPVRRAADRRLGPAARDR